MRLVHYSPLGTDVVWGLGSLHFPAFVGPVTLGCGPPVTVGPRLSRWVGFLGSFTNGFGSLEHCLQTPGILSPSPPPSDDPCAMGVMSSWVGGPGGWEQWCRQFFPWLGGWQAKSTASPKEVVLTQPR